MADTVVRKHIIFYGRVQDVGFRYFKASWPCRLGKKFR